MHFCGNAWRFEYSAIQELCDLFAEECKAKGKGEVNFLRQECCSHGHAAIVRLTAFPALKKGSIVRWYMAACPFVRSCDPVPALPSPDDDEQFWGPPMAPG